MPVFTYQETFYLPYSVSMLQNNLSVSVVDDKQFEYSLVHKFGVVTGNQEAAADVLKKPWSTTSPVPTGALVLSIVIFQTKTFLYDGKPVLVALSNHGPYIAFGEELEPIPGYTIEETAAPNAEWSMLISVAILGDDIICLGSCNGTIHLLQIQKPNKEDLVPLSALQTTTRIKILLLKCDRLGLAAADSAGKVWSWTIEKVPVLKGIPTGLTTMVTGMELTDMFVILGFTNGTIRLLMRDSGSLYCEALAHASTITGTAYCPKSAMLLTVGEDSFVRMWQIHENYDTHKFQHSQNEIVEDMMLCGVQFLNEDGSNFGVVGYDRNELVVYSSRTAAAATS